MVMGNVRKKDGIGEERLSDRIASYSLLRSDSGRWLGETGHRLTAFALPSTHVLNWTSSGMYRGDTSE